MTPSTHRAARLPNWPERLAVYIEQARHQPFAWGQQDCAAFAAGAVQAATGRNIPAALGATWRSATTAARLLNTLGGPHAICCNLFGPPIAAPAAQRGDVVCVPIAGQQTLGIWLGNGTWCAPGATGLVFRPAGECTVAWPI